MVRAIVFIVLFLLASCVTAHAEAHRLVWASVIQTMRGIHVMRSFERVPFDTAKECQEFGDSHTSRVEDWTRGRLNLDWDVPITVGFECVAVSDPA